MMKSTAVLFLLMIGAWAHAAPSSFTYQGQLTDASDHAITTATDVIFTVLDPGGTCVLYQEKQSITPNSSGIFSHQVGTGTPESLDPGLMWSKVFTNTPNSQIRASGSANCAAGFTVGALGSEKRLLRVSIGTYGSGDLSPDIEITSVPFATQAGNAENLAGLPYNKFLYSTSATNIPNLTQQQVDNLLFAAAPSPCTSGQYLKYDGTTWTCDTISATGVVSVTGTSPVSVTAGSTPVVSMAKADTSTSGYLDKTDFTAFQAKLGTGSAFSGDVSGTYNTTSVDKIKGKAVTTPSASGQMLVYDGTGITPVLMSGDGTMLASGAMTLKNTGTAGTYFKVTTDAQGRVTSGTALSASDIPSLDWSKIASGTPTTLSGYGITDGVQNAGGTPSVLSGQGASRPSAGTAGRLYIATDDKKIYRDNGSSWDELAGGVTQVDTGAGLTGGPITGGGTISLAPIGSGMILANPTISSTAPVATTVSASIDVGIGSTQGSILYRNGSGWVALPPGASGNFLQTKGASSNPVWAAEAWTTSSLNVYRASGNVGVGNTSPGVRLDVTGTIKIADGGEACSAAANGGMIRYNANNLQFCNGSSWQTLGISGAGLISLGAQTGGSQTFASGSSGTAPAINSASNVHTLNVPLASGAGVTSGTISKIEYDTFNNKLGTTTAFSGDVTGTYNATKVVAIQAKAVSGTAPADTQFLVYNSSSTQYVPVKISGDAGMTNAGLLTLTSIGTAGTYMKVTTDAKGRVTSGSNPTTLGGFGITDGVQNVGGTTPSIQSGSDALKPAFGTAGRLYVATDTQKIYRDSGSAWVAVASNAGTGVSSITAGAGLSGGTITSTGAIALSSIADAMVLANVSGSSAAPSATSLSALIDKTSSTRGSILYRGSAGWVALAPGTSGNLLSTGGAGADPSWIAPVSSVTLAGDVSGASGLNSVNKIKGKTVTAAPTLAGQVLRYDGTNLVPNFISMADLRSNVTGNQALTAGCTSSQTMTWNPATDSLACINITGIAAGSLTNTPAGNVAATTVQNAINELDSEKVAKAGDTMTGTLNLPSNGLVVGTSQLVVSGGNVGIGITPTVARLEISGPVNATLKIVDTQQGLGKVLTSDANGVASWKTPSFDAGSPMTALGDTLYGGSAGVATRLAGNTTTTKKFLSQTGTGSVSAAPSWMALDAGDLSTGTLLAARMPAFTGDVTTTAGSTATTLKNTGTAGTYLKVTTDAQGRVTSGSNPTTLSGFGITDAVKNNGSAATTKVNSMESGTDTAKGAAGSAGRVYLATDTAKIYRDNGTSWDTISSNTGTGISALTGDVTASGTGSVMATVAKVNGVAYPASPATNTVPVVTAANTITYKTVPIAAGGTGATTQSAAINNLLPAPASRGTLLHWNGTAWAVLGPGASGQFLRTGGTTADPSWATASGSGTVTSVDTGTGLTGGPITIGGTLALATVPSVSPGTYGDNSNVGSFTVDAYGRITAASNRPVQANLALATGTLAVANGGTGTATGSITGTGALTFASGANGDINIDPNGTGNSVIKGQVRSVNSSGVPQANGSAAVDWNNGNAQSMNVACTTTAFTNLRNGGTYVLAVSETSATKCVFSQSGYAFYYSPPNTNRILNQRTVYTFQVIGSEVYVSWVPGFQ